MIRKPTTLILGAGASVPYGYPTGEGLKSTIIDLVTAVVIQQGNSTSSINGRMVHEGVVHGAMSLFDSRNTLIDKDDFGTPEEHKEFVTKFSADSASSTIDRFLFENKEYSEIGRFYTVLSLLIYQYSEKITPQSQKSKLEDSPKPALPVMYFSDELPARDDWYNSLVTKLRAGCSTPESLEKDNHLRVLTFNYDRSFELYLQEYLAKPSRYEGAEWSKVVEVKHLYGALPSAPTGADAITLYDLALHAWNNRSEIRLIGDRDDDSRLEIQKMISNSDQVSFIGFGFDDANIGLLGLPETLGETAVNCHNFLSREGAHSTGVNRRTRSLFVGWSAELNAERRQLNRMELKNRIRQLGGELEQMKTILPSEREDFFESRIFEDIQAGLLGFN